MKISPVDVVMLHSPPVVDGTCTFPVLVWVWNVLSLRRLPVTSPVLVLISNVSASLLTNLISPVDA